MGFKGFEGWYFKHQANGEMLAFIPGRAESGAFIQMIGTMGSRHFKVEDFEVKKNVIKADNCRFSEYGCSIDLPGVKGEIEYKGITPLRYDIMGPFKYLPMECRHGVISMNHTLSGGISVDGVNHSFNGGTGYIEKDSGRSFPKEYLWIQCNSFSKPCSIMASIAHIPFCGTHFTGCICAIVFCGQEYRLATYKGVRILKASKNHIKLKQGKLLLEVDITPTKAIYPLYSPQKGQMSGTVREGVNAKIHARLFENGKTVFDLNSDYAAYEYVKPQNG